MTSVGAFVHSAHVHPDPLRAQTELREILVALSDGFVPLIFFPRLFDFAFFFALYYNSAGELEPSQKREPAACVIYMQIPDSPCIQLERFSRCLKSFQFEKFFRYTI